MLQVLLVDDTPDRASALHHALASVKGVSVAGVLDSPLELMRKVHELRPDVVLIATDSPSRDVLEQLAVVSSEAPRPVVLFTDDAHEESIRASIRVGVSAYIIDGIAPARLEPILRVAMERFESDQRLRAELSNTKRTLAERRVVERAKGILMKQRGMDEEAAYTALRKLAMERGIRVGEAAQQVVDVTSLLG
jgi:two-component system, response regulator / RNA-binding antiterminator